MSYDIIAKFKNEHHTFEVHKHETSFVESEKYAYYVVRDDDQQHGAYHDEDRAIEVAEDWAGNDGERVF